MKKKVKIESSSNPDIILESFIFKEKEDRLYLHVPADKSAFVSVFQPEERILLSIYKNSGIKILNSIVLDLIDNRIIVVSTKASIHNIQRREFARVDVELNGYIDINNEIYRIKTLDIGGGGIKFLSTRKIEVDTLGELTINLYENEKKVKVFGKILKKSFYREDEYLFYFLEINENERTKILKKCFEIEANLIKENMDK